MLQLQTRFLLDVPWGLEEPWERVLRVLKIQGLYLCTRLCVDFVHSFKSVFVHSFVWIFNFCFNYEMLQENPNIANESAHAQAREALKKYLHYFERVSPLQPFPYI